MSDHLHATFVPDCWRCDLARDEVREIQHLALTDSTSTRDRAAWRLARIAEDETVALNDAVLRTDEIKAWIASQPKPKHAFMSFMSNPDACPDRPHRGPEGPNEDLSQCALCLMPSWSLRPEGEEFGGHLADCSLPRRHESYCVGGGQGHPEPTVLRGFWLP